MRTAPGDALLALLGPEAAPVAVGFAASDWQRLNRLAARHRLQPRLHALHRGSSAIPEAIRQSWQAAYRASALRALTWQAELAECCALLRAGGFAPIALKGAWLARHAYPHPAERPLRDFDLLLDSATAIPAFELLAAHGYRLAEPLAGTLAETIVRFRHLPVLIAPRGTAVELHQWLWEQESGPVGLPTGTAETRMRRGAVELDGVHYPAAADLLDHLVVHALYSHRLDCGPLVLPDLALLADTAAIDWATWWNRARSGGWAAGAALLFALAWRYHGPSALPDKAPDGLQPGEAVLAAAAALLVTELEHTGSVHGLAQALQGGAGGLRQRFAALPSRYEHGFAHWLVSRGVRHAGRMLSPAFRAQARNHARLIAWLDR